MTLTMGMVLLVLGGLVVVAVGVLFLPSTLHWAVTATESVEGAVVGHDRKETDEAVYYYSLVAFVVDGKGWVIRGKCGYVRPQPRVGKSVRVYFPPGNPDAAELDRFGGLWVALGLIAFALAMATLSICVWLQD